jgi:predicted permease
MNWWKRLFLRRKLEDQLERELSFHLEQHVADLIAQGHTPVEARRLARLELGGPQQVKEECRDARGTRWLEDLVQDVRYAVRTLRKRPGFAAMALATIALGTGATTVMFTVINGVLLKPFAYRDPARLLRLQEQTGWSTPQGNLWSFTFPNYLDCKSAIDALDMAAWTIKRGTVSTPSGAAEYVEGVEVSSDLLSLLGVKAAQGRTFFPEEDRPAATPVAVISHRLSQRRFGGSASAVGSEISFDGKSYSIVGVLPADFRLADAEFDVWTPIGQDSSPRFQSREVHNIRVWARLRPGVTLSQVRSELSTVGNRLAQQYPKTNKDRTFIATQLRPIVGDTQSTLWLLLGAVGLVLLIACANIANLLLARAVSQEREFSVRVALGAGRGRLVRQCLTESAVLALAGGALGILLAAAGIRPFMTFWPGGLPRAQEIGIDWRVLVFALGISIASGILFGLAPALRAPARGLEQALRAGARTVAGDARRLHRSFVVAEIAIAMVLLTAAGVMGRTLLRLSSLDPGVNIRNVLTARTALSPATLPNPDRTRAAWQDLLDRARRIPGVQAIAAIDTVPMRDGNNQIYYSTNAGTVPEDQKTMVLANSTTPDYLKVTGIPLRRGRFITESDRKGTQSVAVIDDVMAEQAFAGQDPIGKQLWIGIGPDPVTVVGVVGHVRQFGLAADDQARVRAQLYYPFAQVPDMLVRRWSELMSIIVRTNVDPRTLIEPLRQALRGGAGDQVLYEIGTLEEFATASLARQRFLLLLFGVFATLALLLACIGIYGVLAYLTNQRTSEIGLRMALGASSPGVLWMVLRQSLTMILAGIALGTLAAFVASRTLAHLVDGVRASDPVAFAVMILLLILAATFASFIPARRASRIDPMKALRQE